MENTTQFSTHTQFKAEQIYWTKQAIRNLNVLNELEYLKEKNTSKVIIQLLNLVHPGIWNILLHKITCNLIELKSLWIALLQ